jgi:hypothetical protein
MAFWASEGHYSLSGEEKSYQLMNIESMKRSFIPLLYP